MSEGGLELPHQVPLARPLLAAHLVFDYLAQVRYGLGVLPRVDVIVGIGVVPLLAGTPMD